MKQLVDKYIGEKYNLLTIIEFVDRDKNGIKRYKCQCDCGKEKIIRINDVRSGKTKSCGCLAKQRSAEQLQKYRDKRIESGKLYYKDLTGQQFGRLKVLEFDLQETQKRREQLSNKDSYWKCVCECGNIVIVRGADLSYGSTKSCGCLQREISIHNLLTYAQPLGAQARLNDLTNQNFGKLKVIQRSTQNTNHNRPKWDCLCECGNMVSVSGADLVSGHTQSCGCLGNSQGEHKIKLLLEQHHIPFVQEVKFTDLQDKTYLRFDFGLLNDEGQIVKLIEYDGRQHFDVNSIWYTKEILQHDEMKNQYCQKNNIPLLRIPYTELNNISIDKLLNERTF